MQLVELFTIRANLGETSMIGAAPSGVRAIAEVVGGTFSGVRLRGDVLTPGADWVVIGDGYGELDVRLNLKTDDGVSIYMHYTGVMEQNEASMAALGGGPETQYGDSYFVSQPRFECGDERYAWLNHVVAVAEGRVLPGAVEYCVYECRPGGAA
jgi:hypothetical protein